MNCSEIQLLLNNAEAESRYALASERDAVDEHLASCADCRDQWHAQALIAGLRVPSPSAGLLSLAQRALPAAVGESGARRATRPRSLTVGVILLAGAAAAAALLNLSFEPEDKLETEVAMSPEEDAPAFTAGAEVVDAEAVDDAPAPADATTGASGDSGSTSPIGLDRSWVAVLPIPPDAASGELLAVANERREMLMQQVAATEGLMLVDPGRVQSYFDGGMSDLEIGRALGAGVVIIPAIETRELASRISFSKLDPVDESLLGGTEFIYRADLADLAAVNAERFRRENEFLWDNNLSVLIGVMLREAHPELAPSADERFAQNQDVLLDISRSDVERVGALEELSGMRRHDSIVVNAAIGLLENSASADVRRRAAWTMKRMDDPMLVQPLLGALAWDASPGVRLEAVGALGKYADDPSVSQALARAAASDSDADVRATAAWLGLSDSERLARRRQEFLDPNRPTAERVHKLNIGIGSSANDPPLPVDNAIARELLEISLNDPNQGVRAVAMTELFYIGEQFPDFRLDPSLRAPLIGTLKGNADPNLRVTAIYALRLMPDSPEIREALETARDNDTDRLVRNWARQMLEGRQ